MEAAADFGDNYCIYWINCPLQDTHNCLILRLNDGQQVIEYSTSLAYPLGVAELLDVSIANKEAPCEITVVESQKNTKKRD